MYFLQGRSIVLFRALTSFIFIYAGVKHFVHREKVLGRLQHATIYEWFPNDSLFGTLVNFSGLLMILGGFLLLAGRLVKFSSLLLLIVLVPITLSVQLENLSDLGPFFKNLAIAASLIFLYQNSTYELQKN